MKYSRVLGLLLISTGVSAAPSNPPSMSIVEEAIAAAFATAVKLTTYTAGTAISIENNVVSGDYQPGAGITINGDTISGNYQAGNSALIVDNTAGTIAGNYQAGSSALTIDNATGTISGNYQAGNPALTVDNATGIISGNYQAGNSALTVNNATGTIAGNYQAGNPALTVDNATGTISGNYQAGDSTLTINNAAGTITGNYVAGTGIAILNDNQITVTGATQPYTAGAGLDLTGTEFSIMLAASDTTLVVDNAAGTIRGNYVAGTGIIILNDNEIAVTGATQPYTAGGGLLLTGTVFSTNLSVPDSTLIIDNAAGTIRGNYSGGVGITVDNTTGEIAQSQTYVLGDTLEGGTIFYLDDTKRHGLMVLTSALSGGTALPLTLSTTPKGQAFANGIGAGMVNSQYWQSKMQTDLDIAAATTGNIGATAAGSALNLSLMFNGSSYTNCPTGDGSTSKTCFGGWYLPSLNELGLIYTQFNTPTSCTGTSATLTYWSSTSTPSGTAETSSTTAYALDFSDGSLVDTSGINTVSLCVLPIRQF